MTNLLLSIYRFLASLKLAVILLVVFAVLLSVATFYESHTSTQQVQQLIYKTQWFDFFLFLLGVNVFCAAAIRFPWKKRQFGFVITHLGIIIILIGSMITRKFGVEGQIALVEGQSTDAVLVNETVFAVSAPRLNVREEYDPWFVEKPIPKGKEVQYQLGNTGITCFVDRYIFNPRLFERVNNNNRQPNPAVQVGLHQPGQATPGSEHWLFAQSSERNRLNLGMAMVRFKQVHSEEELKTALEPPSTDPPGPDGVVVFQSADQEAVQQVPLKQILDQPYSFEWNNQTYTAEFKTFFARAAVKNNELIERDAGPLNPAVRLMLKGSNTEEEHLAFSQIPEIGSIHGQQSQGSGLQVAFEYPIDKYSGNTNEALILLAPDGKLHYRATNTAGSHVAGEITTGQPFQTTWPAVQLSVQRFYPRAVLTEEIVDAGRNASGPHNNPVMHVRVEHQGQSAADYVSYNRPQRFTVGNETVQVDFGQRRVPLGFAIQLVDFQAPRYPGTNRPARFQSLVKVMDPDQQTSEEQLIFMNNPLAKNRFLVYQSGYEEGRNGGPDTSIFSVAWAPGTSTIYVGSIILCLGMVLMFISRRAANATQTAGVE